jgi:hypothetical protein
MQPDTMSFPAVIHPREDLDAFRLQQLLQAVHRFIH